MPLKRITWSIALCFTLGSHLGLTATTTRVSVNSFGVESNEDSCCERLAISADGRFVAFASEATNLVVGDTNRHGDVFVHDRRIGSTTRVSVNSQGQQANGPSGLSPIAISANGRFVAYQSEATNLVADDTNDARDVFLRDRETGETTRVSVGSGGLQAEGDSGDSLAISGNGQFVAFQSNASDLVADDTNSESDIFVHDRLVVTTTRVSVNSSGQESKEGSFGPAISGDGRFVAFTSAASDLVDGDTNSSRDAFVHDRGTGETTLVSVNSLGQQFADGTGFNTAINADGRFVAFDVEGQILLRDRMAATTILVSVNSLDEEANSVSDFPSISATGRFVAFMSLATNLVPDDMNSGFDIFVRDRESRETTRVSVNSNGEEANDGSLSPALSADGRFVTFLSDANNLVPNDTNDRLDAFLRDRDRDIVNGYVSLAPRFGSFRMGPQAQDCVDGFSGQFSFEARLENTGDADLTDLHVLVSRLTRRNRLVTESGLIGPNGEFPVPERDDFADGILGVGESLTVPLKVCLRSRKPFRLFVDVAEDTSTNVGDSAGPPLDFRFIVGSTGDDTLNGTRIEDMIIGLGGNDTIKGGGGDDWILGGPGNDELRGGQGQDEIWGGGGRDVLYGNRGDDLLFGNRGDDELNGGPGDDKLWGNRGSDTLRGNQDDDVLRGGPDDDVLDGGIDVDVCVGGPGSNRLRRCEL